MFDYYVWDDPGHACGKRIKPDAPVTREYIIEGVLGDAAKRKGEGVVLLINSPEDLPDGALLVVCKISSDEVDYHFAVQLPNGVWIDKPGGGESRYNKIDGFADEWVTDAYTYDSAPIYFAYFRPAR